MLQSEFRSNGLFHLKLYKYIALKSCLSHGTFKVYLSFQHFLTYLQFILKKQMIVFKNTVYELNIIEF